MSMKTPLESKLAAAGIVGFMLSGVWSIAFAQDRTITVREVDVVPRRAEVNVRPDGGCMLTAYAEVSSPSVEPFFVRGQYPFNGPRCTAVKDAIAKAAKKDLGVGDGTDP
jgi:hypothetical protein